MFACAWQGETVAPTAVPVGSGTLAWILIGIGALGLAALAFWFGRVFGGWRSRRAYAADKERMFTIEKALQDFFETDRKRLETEGTGLRERVEMLTKHNEELRKKAAGVGMMGMGADRKSELLLSLMAENEALEEKLYTQNRKAHEERESHLKDDLQHISIKRVMLSELLKTEPVQASLRAVLADDATLRRITVDRPPEPVERAAQGATAATPPDASRDGAPARS